MLKVNQFGWLAVFSNQNDSWEFSVVRRLCKSVLPPIFRNIHDIWILSTIHNTFIILCK